MRKLFAIIIAIAILTACGGGSPVDKAIGQVEKAIEKVEKNKGNMTEDDWQALEKEVEAPLKTINEALEAGKVDTMEKLRIVTVTAKWTTILMEVGLTGMEQGNHIKNFQR